MRDEEDDVLYVGKAASLYHRVSSYFGSSHNLSAKLQNMVSQIADFEFIVTDSEQEAFLLENHLIKRYRPHYNVMLKDDKTYPYLKIALAEDWPGIYVTRRLLKDGSRYFGPFADAGSVRRTLALLRRLFLFRNCKGTITGHEPRPCLEYHIHRCLGPCISAISKEEYRHIIDQVVLFLEGKQEIVLRELQSRMVAAAERLEFEKAALIRDQISAVEKVGERQKIASVEGEMDVIAFARSSEHAYVLVFVIRNGKLLGKEHFVLTGTQGEAPSEIMTSFVQQFYGSAPYVPKQILLQYAVEDSCVVQDWLRRSRGSRVELRVPRRGMKKELVDMVAENARQGLEQMRIKLLAQPDVVAVALDELKTSLALSRLPQRIECYDISNVQGAHAVGSMVVFERGQPRKSLYRRFKIRSVAGANDYAMIREVLRRRFKRMVREPEGSNWTAVPDLVLIDGGKGQLNAALEAMRDVGLDSIACASIAKETEAIYLPQAGDPVVLDRDSSALYLVQRLRDEAHRFAVGYYRKVHRRDSLSSALDAIPGIGAKRRRSLLRRFGSARKIKEADVADLASVKGMTRPVAERIKAYL